MSRVDDKIKELERELFFNKKAKRLFSDVEITKDRWNTERLYSVKANPKTNKVEISHGCGCCSDAALYARPYLKVEGVEVYSDPPSFTIGYGNSYGYGEEESDGWEEKMRESNISEEVIRQCREYLDDNKPKPYEDDYEDEDYDD
jgi:hypothetical protein